MSKLEDCPTILYVRKFINQVSIESTGIIKPTVLVKSALRILIEKCQKYIKLTKSSED